MEFASKLSQTLVAEEHGHTCHQPLSRRELFAMAAMQGMIANAYSTIRSEKVHLIPGAAVAMADGLIAALNEKAK